MENTSTFENCKKQIAADKEYHHLETMEQYLNYYSYLDIVKDAAELYAQEKAREAVQAFKTSFIEAMQNQDIWSEIDQSFRSLYGDPDENSEDREDVWRNAVRWFIEEKLK